MTSWSDTKRLSDVDVTLLDHRANLAETDMMTDEQLDTAIEALAQAMLEYHDRLVSIVKPLPYEDVAQVAAECRRRAKPDETKNFAVPEWDLVAEKLEGELAFRAVGRLAEAYFAENPDARCCCVYCGGACTPEHLAELADGATSYE
jgi:hypothetical protein